VHQATAQADAGQPVCLTVLDQWFDQGTVHRYDRCWVPRVSTEVRHFQPLDCARLAPERLLLLFGVTI
jgi:hypothetical protein